jgi:hypothetical protein
MDQCHFNKFRQYEYKRRYRSAARTNWVVQIWEVE